MRGFKVGLAASLVTGYLAAAPSFSACANSGRSNNQPVGYDAVYINANSVPGNLMDEVNRAMGAWNAGSCNTDGTSFPRFQGTAAGAGRSVTIVYQTGINPDNDESCGRLTGNNILLYSVARKPNGTTYSCETSNIFEDNVAHELGHLVGLQHTNCSGYIMRPVEFTSSGNYIDRRVRSSECRKVRDTNKTPFEFREEMCELDPHGPGCDGGHPCDPCGSPVVLDLSRDGFVFVGTREGVDFDIDGDAVLERSGWARRSWTPEAFLCLDRNGNGVIDSGRELFGDATLFLNGEEAQNGYQALFELEIEFGDGDGVIEPNDAIYGKLRVWEDRNGNGRSERGELRGLREVNVAWIETQYLLGVEVDEHGNWLRFVSRAALKTGDGSIRVIDTADVFFDLEEE